MQKELSIRISGEAGQGLVTMGTALCSIFKKAGYHLFANKDYMSRVRGGNNFFQIRVSTRSVRSLREKVDILIPLNKESIELHQADCRDEAVIMGAEDWFEEGEPVQGFVGIPYTDLTSKDSIYANSAAIGVLGGMMKLEFSIIKSVLLDMFGDKDEDVSGKNLQAASAGYEYGRDLKTGAELALEEGTYKNELMLNGNQSIALGAIQAGMKFFTAYPMTPSTSIMNTVAHFMHDFDILVEQAEDEIAAVNMALGASAAGVRTMTGTSGGGFALMQEGVSLAGMTETPVVIAVSQRPGPATGLPTRTEQGDLNFLIHAGHGDFAKAVFAPGSIEECFYLTIKAFQLADKYQIPVIIMTDQYLADAVTNLPSFSTDKVKVSSYRINKQDSAKISEYKRYRYTEDGISPRAVPGWIKDVIYIDSDEHTEEGHITESALVRNRMMEKRFFKRMQALEKEVEPPLVHGTEKAETVFLGFGSSHHVIKEACGSLGTEKVGCVHLPQVWPFPREVLLDILAQKKVITIENNAGGQLAGLLLRETGIQPADTILRYDGRPFNLDWLKHEMERRIA